jgi:hypothetical protein
MLRAISIALAAAFLVGSGAPDLAEAQASSKQASAITPLDHGNGMATLARRGGTRTRTADPPEFGFDVSAQRGSHDAGDHVEFGFPGRSLNHAPQPGQSRLQANRFQPVGISLPRQARAPLMRAMPSMGGRGMRGLGGGRMNGGMGRR